MLTVLVQIFLSVCFCRANDFPDLAAKTVVLQLWNRRQLGAISYELGFNSKHTKNEAVQQTGPGAHRTPARLAFADHVNHFIAGHLSSCRQTGPSRFDS